MKRQLIALVTGLALLAQGTALAGVAPQLEPPAQHEAGTPEMPCHGDDSDEMSAAPCDCCNGGCVFACGGAPLQALEFATLSIATVHAFPAAAVLAPLASHALDPFRPPAA